MFQSRSFRWRTTGATVLALCACVALALTACDGDATATTKPAPTSAAVPTVPTAAPGSFNLSATAPLPNSTLPEVKNGTAKLAAPLNPTDSFTFDVLLKIPNSDDMLKIAQKSDDPNTLQNIQRIKQGDYDLKYAPKSAVDNLQKYIAASGLTVVNINASKLTARFTGTVAQVEKLFEVTLNTYTITRKVASAPSGPINGTLQGQDPNGTVSSGGVTPASGTSATTTTKTITFYANDKDVHIPADYIPFVDSIVLNNMPVTSRLVPSAAGGTVYGYYPSSLQAAYNVKDLQTLGYTGQDQTIAVFAVNGYNPDDIQKYADQFKLPSPNIEVIPIDGADSGTSQNSIEVELDIEAVMAMAPDAKILLYEAPDDQFFTSLSDTISAMADDGRANILSISYGGCELQYDSSDMQSFDTAAKYARAHGITIFAAAGDDGAYDCARSYPDEAGTLAVDFPASDPNVVAVGGTALFMQSGQYKSEQAWSNSDEGSGTGGGISMLWPTPSFQNGYNSQKTRTVPDIAAVADSRTGMIVYCSVVEAQCEGWMALGGTSLAAPVTAAGTLLVDQYLQDRLKSRDKGTPLLYGPINFYQLQTAYTKGVIKAAPYRDITQGDNLHYKAGKGYDLTTGIGTPNFSAMAQDLEQLYHSIGIS